MGYRVPPLPPASREESLAQIQQLTSRLVDRAWMEGFLLGCGTVVVLLFILLVWR